MQAGHVHRLADQAVFQRLIVKCALAFNFQRHRRNVAQFSARAKRHHNIADKVIHMRHRVVYRFSQLPPAQYLPPCFLHGVINVELLLQMVGHFGVYPLARQRTISLHPARSGNFGIGHMRPAVHRRIARHLAVFGNALKQHAFGNIALGFDVARSKAHHRIALFAHARPLFAGVVAPHHHHTGFFTLVAVIVAHLPALGLILRLLAALHLFKQAAPFQVLAFHGVAQSPAHGLAKLFIERIQRGIARHMLGVQARQIGIFKALAARLAQHIQCHQVIALLCQNLAHCHREFLQFWRHLHPVR